jgi:molecular chaperone GrpE
MKVKVKGSEFNSESEPIMVQFEEGEEINFSGEDSNYFIKRPSNITYQEAINIINSEELNIDWKSKYQYLAADFQNYKKRAELDKQNIINSTKKSTLEKVLEIENDISVAIQNLDEVGRGYLNPISNKLISNLNSIGLSKIQTESYDSDIHEVISVVPGDGNEKIVSVVSNGWILDGKVIKHPKIILSK